MSRAEAEKSDVSPLELCSPDKRSDFRDIKDIACKEPPPCMAHVEVPICNGDRSTMTFSIYNPRNDFGKIKDIAICNNSMFACKEPPPCTARTAVPVCNGDRSMRSE